MRVRYQKICLDLLKTLPRRMAEVIERRFGLKSGQRETLQSIGNTYNITRERVRQIEAEALNRLREKAKRGAQPVFRYFTDSLKTFGDLKKEDLLLDLLGESKFHNQAYLLLTLGEEFERCKETDKTHSLWTISFDSLNIAEKTIDLFLNRLRKSKKPLSLREDGLLSQLPKPLGTKELESYLEISKYILKGPRGLYGLKEWPEINPKSIRDKIYLVFQEAKKPLHFTEVAKLIRKLDLPQPQREFSVQTVHNELIRDSRYVLVGRGIYALRDWGYFPGVVKEVISRILSESQTPLTKEEIIEKVRKQRLVKKNTILLNLQDKNYFLKDSEGRYKLKIV